MRAAKHLVKSILAISPALLLTVVAVGGVRADAVSSGAKQEGWKQIIVAADPLMVKSVPTPGQLAYQTNQLGAFLHYGLAVYADGNMFSDPDPRLFNPAQLDAEQWVRVAKSFGAKHLIFTAKHHSGFCLWPTKTTDYSVRSSPWKNGRGDVVREVADACKKYGIGLGLYYSGYDHHYPCYAGNPSSLRNREAYWTVYRQQIEELLTNYGDIVCLWLDGYNDPFLWTVTDPATGRLKSEAIDPGTGKLYGDEIVALVKAKQPNIVISQGAKPESHGFSDEEGSASYPLWNVLRKGEGKPFYLPPWAEGWIVPEAHNCHGTFAWVPTTPQKLMDNYYHSIGRGANFLAAMVPDKRGLIDEAQAECWTAWGAELQLRFANLLAQTDSNHGWIEPGMLEIDLGSARNVAHIVIEEKIATGQHVLKYAMDAEIDGNWKTIAEGQSIGRKRIERFQPAIRAKKLRLRILQANAVPTISTLAVYGEAEPLGAKTGGIPTTAKKELTKLPGLFDNGGAESTPLWYRGREIMFHSMRPLTPDHAKAVGQMYLALRGTDWEPLARFGQHHGLGCAFVDGDTVHVFAAEANTTDWFHDIFHFSSTDLKTWKRELAIQRDGGEHLLNSSVCRDQQGYLMAYETDLPVRCCFKFARSKDLCEWKKIDGLAFAGIDGKELSGCPVIRYCAPYYYAIYFHKAVPGHNGWVSFLARSKDLITWQLSPQNPILEATAKEGTNNSDVDLIELDGKTYVYYLDGDQGLLGNLRRAVYPGTMQEFFESYFPPELKSVEVSAKLP